MSGRSPIASPPSAAVAAVAAAAAAAAQSPQSPRQQSLLTPSSCLALNAIDVISSPQAGAYDGCGSPAGVSPGVGDSINTPVGDVSWHGSPGEVFDADVLHNTSVESARSDVRVVENIMYSVGGATLQQVEEALRTNGGDADPQDLVRFINLLQLCVKYLLWVYDKLSAVTEAQKDELEKANNDVSDAISERDKLKTDLDRRGRQIWRMQAALMRTQTNAVGMAGTPLALPGHVLGCQVIGCPGCAPPGIHHHASGHVGALSGHAGFQRMSSGLGWLHPSSHAPSLSQCTLCQKWFDGPENLTSHLERRHALEKHLHYETVVAAARSRGGGGDGKGEGGAGGAGPTMEAGKEEGETKNETSDISVLQSSLNVCPASPIRPSIRRSLTSMWSCRPTHAAQRSSSGPAEPNEQTHIYI
eukprot:GHVU01031479.1.p1 GENE.GHVU01031479.1~~GHVU01031479.1.p1  ORF type:complete len:416 (+),score=68.29 GHVU01031479.1:605-1852(+)